ncbi:MAG: signal peptidase I [Candidatus Sulfotelmatobacter sp.]|jgi:signal peptidase I
MSEKYEDARLDRAIASILDVWRGSGKISCVKISTGSMEPFIRPGAIVVVDHSTKDFRIGDIVVFRNSDHMTAHRIVAVNEGHSGIIFQTRGDNTADRSESVPEALVMGKVIEVHNSL